MTDTQSKQGAVAAATNGGDEIATSVEHGTAAFASVDSGSTSSVENLPLFSDTKVQFIFLCKH